MQLQSMIKIHTCILCMAAPLATVGCGTPDRTVLRFETPRVLLHIHADPKDTQHNLKVQGPSMTREGESDYFTFQGLGMVEWNSTTITILADQIKVNGVAVESPDNERAYRNATLMRNGTVEEDRFIPWEPWWAHHW